MILGLLGHAGCGKDAVADYLVEHSGFVKMSLADEMKRFAKKVFDLNNEQLWGPSHYRNSLDHRYSSINAWDEAEGRLYIFGPDWCRMLFPSLSVSITFAALTDWFDHVRANYGIDWGRQNTLTTRVILQTIGTEFGRTIDPQVWVNSTLNIAKKVLSNEYAYTRLEGLIPIAEVVAQGRLLTSTKIFGVVIPDCRFRNELVGIHRVGGTVIRIKRPGIKLAQVGISGHASEAEQDSIPDSDFDHILVSPEGLPLLYQMLDVLIPDILANIYYSDRE